MHARFTPKKYRLSQKIFMFYLDLDELDGLAKRSRFFSHNRFDLFDFRDSDHFPGESGSLRENFFAYLKTQGVTRMPAKVRMLTNVRVLGYVFNPVSFYFCFDEQDQPLQLVAEVGNTFGEQKPYFLGADKRVGDHYIDRQAKHYYISPFIPLDAELDFHVELPQDRFVIRVDDWREGEKFFISSMTGRKRPFSDKNLLKMAACYPMVTLQVIAMIHWHAFRLWMKGVPHHKKEERPDLQRGLTRARIQK